MRLCNRWVTTSLQSMIRESPILAFSFALVIQTPSEIVFHEQSYASLYSGQSLAWDRFLGNIDDPCGIIADPCGVIADPCGVIADPCGVIADPCGVIADPCGVAAIHLAADADRCATP